jgi:hypothetical protein
MAIVATRTETTDLAPLLGRRSPFRIPTGPRLVSIRLPHTLQPHHLAHFAPLPMAGLVFTRNASKRYAASRATYQFPDVRKLLSCQLIPLELIFDEGILRAREIS